MAIIDEAKISYSDLSLADPVGRLFHWNGGVYRGIHPGKAEQVLELFQSGFIQALMQRGLFPDSHITDHVLKGFSFVVKHERISCVCYPHEWTFDMLRDAALAVLDVAEICTTFGWDIKDGHPYNVLFTNSRPVYIDLGSFEKKNRGIGFEKGLDFVRLYWRPLYIWSLGDSFLARRIISSTNADQPDFSWWLYRHPLLSQLGIKWNKRLVKKSSRWLRRFSRYLHHGRWLSWFSPSLASRLPAEIIARTPSLLRLKFARLRLPPPDSWDDYHSEHLQNGEFVSTPRFERILEIIQSLDCESVVELAGNQGLFTLLLATKTKVKKIVCTDYSSSAVNRFYSHCRNNAEERPGKIVQAAVHNFMLPEWSARESRPSERFKSDAVVALAVTHHLILTQNFSLHEIVRTIAGYTRRYALVEFMPLGLWNGKSAPPVPDWYTADWFQEIFARYFEVMAVEQIEENRILFVGRLKTDRSANSVEESFEFFETRKQAA